MKRPEKRQGISAQIHASTEPLLKIGYRLGNDVGTLGPDGVLDSTARESQKRRLPLFTRFPSWHLFRATAMSSLLHNADQAWYNRGQFDGLPRTPHPTEQSLTAREHLTLL